MNMQANARVTSLTIKGRFGEKNTQKLIMMHAQEMKLELVKLIGAVNGTY
jgi:hypothetical protein